MLYTKDNVADFKSQTFAYLIVEEDDHVLNITLNRPEKKNAMNPMLMNELVYALSYAHHTPSVWVVVLQAKGDVFCAGADLKAFAGQSPDGANSSIPEPPAPPVMGDAFNSLHKPCIAKVHGNVYAGGFLLICGCTHVIASGNVQLSLPEVKRGIWPMQVMASLKPIVPARKLLDLCMRARAISATEAQELGIVTEVTAVTDLDERVSELVDELKTLSPTAIRLGLQAWDELKNVSSAEMHPFLLGRLQEILGTEDAAEGLQAFIEKRKPEWKGK